MEQLLQWIPAGQRHNHPPNRHTNRRTDLQQFQANRVAPAAGQRRAGLIDEKADRYAQARASPIIVEDGDGKLIGGHLADFHTALLATGATAKHADMKRSQAACVLKLCKAKYLDDLDPIKVQLALRSLRDEHGLSLQTLNHYLRSIKQFSRWLWRNGRWPENVLKRHTTLATGTDDAVCFG